MARVLRLARPLAPLAAALSLAAGCGVSQGLYNARLLDLRKCESEKSVQTADYTRRLMACSKERDVHMEEAQQAQATIDKLQGDRAALTANLQATKREVEDLRRAQQLADERNRDYQTVLDRLRARGQLGEGKLTTGVRRGRLFVRIPSEILFNNPLVHSENRGDREGSPEIELKPEGQALLRDVAVALREVPGRDYLVIGHTDSAPPPRGFHSNWELSAACATVVVQFLQSSGLDPRRLGIAGYSEFDPLTEDRSPAGRALNRRIEIVVLPKPEELPQLDERPAPPKEPL
ncbi:MAG TPA: OmpA family protein [Polyangia bacterium]|nr:OmpA family protein [Polyangia bacterium]